VVARLGGSGDIPPPAGGYAVERPHPNHLFALEMLELLADEDAEPQAESRGVSGSVETVSSDNDKHGDETV
jgi:hypothetical protein